VTLTTKFACSYSVYIIAISHDNMSTNTFSNKERTKWEILSFSLIGILIGSTTTATIFLQIPQQLLNGSVTGHEVVNAPSIVITAYGAGVLTNVFALPADNLFSTKTYYTIAFTTATAGAIKEIEMTFPNGFNIANAKLLQVQGIGAGSLSVSGQVVKYTVSSAVSVPASAAIKISIADITNAATTSNQVAVTTKAISGPNVAVVDGPTNSAVFTLVQVSNAMLASSAVTAPKIAANSIDNTKIQDGQVTTADLAANLVDASKIKDGSIGRAEVSTAFIKKVTIPDQNTGSDRVWDPDGSRQDFFINDVSAKKDSIISVTLNPNAALRNCYGFSYGMSAAGLPVIWIHCDRPPHNGWTLNYMIVN
jgi:hypothetical protein